ncbi:MAG TPA: DUF3465 domain-containing protein [Steroidobacteraceae bacterium]|nr:DUF3465 domain-containing protein [Steroidobacteraceae bacterium]
MRRIATVLAAGAVAVGASWYLGRGADDAALDAGNVAGDATQQSAAALQADAGQGGLRQAFEDRARGRLLQIEGRVQRLLADDREGSPHQRFIIVTDSGHTLLVAHNLDLAPRLDGLAVGDQVRLFGEYEWNDQGGVMHWTHDDPAGRHPAGYIDWNGRRFQ